MAAGEKAGATFKAGTQSLGHGRSLGELYNLGKEAKAQCWQSANQVRRIEIPEALGSELKKAAEDIRDAAADTLEFRGTAISNFLEWLDSQKPSKEASVAEYSDKATRNTAYVVQELMKLGTNCGVSTEETLSLTGGQAK
jgi:hypothetical protein